MNLPFFRLYCSGVSQRRCARILNIHRKTVARKLRFWAEQCREELRQSLASFEKCKLTEVIFDEMETFEHSKMKPVSIALAVTPDRYILSTEIATMPAKGPLAEKARKKYGYRPDGRPKALKKLFETLKPIVRDDALFKSDMNPAYPLPLKKAFPLAQHETTKGGRSCVVGQGELKKLLWDPIFSLNHTAAMLRANMNRLFRKTWCTTKNIQSLRDHLALYTAFHNFVLLND